MAGGAPYCHLCWWGRGELKSYLEEKVKGSRFRGCTFSDFAVTCPKYSAIAIITLTSKREGLPLRHGGHGRRQAGCGHRCSAATETWWMTVTPVFWSGWGCMRPGSRSGEADLRPGLRASDGSRRKGRGSGITPWRGFWARCQVFTAAT